MWNGIFKSYSVIKIIPLSKMSSDDWRILEYEGLRNRAKNRIAETATELVGFVLVHVYEKGIGKPFYYQPATPDTVKDFENTGSIPFLNEPDDRDLVPRAKDLDKAHRRLGELIALIGAAGFLKWLFEKNNQSLEPLPPKEPPVISEPNAPITNLPPEDRGLWKELNEMFHNGIADWNELDAALAIALELVKYKGFEFLGGFIDEADDALGWAEEKGLI
jgi:hypothetical protein